MSAEEREQFVADVRIAIISVEQPGKGPVTVPVWYAYEAGGAIRFSTGKNSLKARLIEAAGRIGFCVQTETAPYKYVSIEGPVRLSRPSFERDLHPIAVRYLGERGATRYHGGRSPEEVEGASVLVELTPETWRTVDYGKM